MTDFILGDPRFFRGLAKGLRSKVEGTLTGRHSECLGLTNGWTPTVKSAV